VNVEEYDRGNPALSQDESKKDAAIGQGEKKENIALTSSGNPDDKTKAQMSPYHSFLDDPIFERMQRIADSIKRDVEDQLSRTFHTFRVLEHRPVEDPSQHSSYSMKIKTDDDGHVRVKTDQKQVNSDWKVNVEEYNKGNLAPSKDESPKNALSGQNTALTGTSNQDDKNKVQTFFPSFGDSLFEGMQRIANSIQRDVENQLNRTFETFKVLEHKALHDPDQNASYYMKIKTDDNGHVRVKTMQKKPNSEWKVNVEEYDRGKAALGKDDSRKDAAIGQGAWRENTTMEIENKNQTQTTNP